MRDIIRADRPGIKMQTRVVQPGARRTSLRRASCRIPESHLVSSGSIDRIDRPERWTGTTRRLERTSRAPWGANTEEATLETSNGDRAAYLACYLDSESMARTGPEGFQLGFKAHAAQRTETGWPDRFEAQDLRLVEVRPGFVYGTYRYRVSYGIDEHTGLSERIFVETP